MSNFIYVGHPGTFSVSAHVYKEPDNSDNYNSYPLEPINRHSPDGPNWGYSGSGPADCALSILTDYFKRIFKNNSPDWGKIDFEQYVPKLVESIYHKFKHDIIAPIPMQSILKIEEETIKIWVLENVDLLSDFHKLMFYWAYFYGYVKSDIAKNDSLSDLWDFTENFRNIIDPFAKINPK